MASSVYRVIDVIGTSDTSWEDATAAAVATASGSLRDLRVAEVTKLDVTIGDDGKVQPRPSGGSQPELARDPRRA